jgi:DNA polymerase I
MTIQNSNRDVFLAIDANAIIHRAFHAYPSTLQTKEGVQVNAVYGFTSMLLESLLQFKPKYVLCAMDTSKPTFRHQMYTEYKATRKAIDLSLVDQFPLVEEVLKSFNIPVLKREGFEADDILGTVSKYVHEGVWNGENLDLYILSGDRDLLQLINDRTYVCLPNGNFKNLILYDRDKTIEKFGYSPEQVVDYKGIVGDNSDNIPGIKGVGDKTALGLLNRFGTLDEIYRNINEVNGRFKTLLVEGIEQAEFSRQLATIDRDVPIDIHITDCILKDLDRNLLSSTFKKYEFRSLINRLDDIFGKEEKLNSKTQLDMFSTNTANEFKWNTQEEAVEALKSCISATVVYISEEESYDSEAFLLLRVFNEDKEGKDFLVKMFDVLKYLEGKVSIFYNFEDLVTYSDIDLNTDTSNFYDVLLAEHILNSQKRNVKIKDLAFDYSTKILNEKISPDSHPLVMDTMEDTYIAQKEKLQSLELYDYTKESIKRFLGVEKDLLLTVLKEVEIPVSIILSKMESRGIQLDWDALCSLRDDVDREIGKVTSEIYSIVGHEFNINSPKQLSDVLYKELNLPVQAKGSTKESILQTMMGLHPIIEHLLYFREITKIKSTYVEPLYQNSLVESDGKRSVHTDFKQTGTTSGRFSSINPNMQNLPLDGIWAKRVRDCFVARDGYQLLAMDYSQMELRIMADISNDKLLIQDFINGLDIHTSTAARVLDKKLDEVTHKERNLGKTVNFGMIFGQTPYGLSRLLGIDRDLAGKYINAYFEHYKGVEQYMRKIEYEAFEKGYVQTMFGTTRNIAGIRSRNVRMKAAAAREAINMPIQGSEADIMKLVMVRIGQFIEEKYNSKAYILLQIHDEIVMEVENSLVEMFSEEVKSIMLETVSLDVPFDVHVSSGSRLSDLK